MEPATVGGSTVAGCERRISRRNYGETMTEKNAGNEWQKQPTVDGSDDFIPAEWVEPAPGTVIEGTLMRAFVLRDDMGGAKPFRACYVVADADGNEWTFGEKATFRTAIRALKLGVMLRLTFVSKEKMTDPKTKKPTGKTVWRTRLETLGDGVGETVAEALKASHAALVEKGEDLPF
jgi:hypothetical protein